jgi:hypothetical protein
VGETALTVAVLAFFGFRLASGAQFAASTEGRRRVGEIARGIRWRHIWPVPIVWMVVVAVALALLEVPGLSWGWWSALGGQGNPIIGGTDRAAGTVFEWLIPLVFLTLLVPALPLFAMREEEIFRQGAEHWSNWKRLGKATVFGLVHAVVGIPIGVALALTIGGLYFTQAYLRAWRATQSERGAVLESARAHTAYNACIVVLAYVVVVWSAFS